MLLRQYGDRQVALWVRYRANYTPQPQTARRVILSQLRDLVLSGKSPRCSRTSRLIGKGRTRDRHDTRDGMRWTWWRLQTSDADTYGQVVWSRRPGAGVKLVGVHAPQKQKKQESRSPRRSRSSRKTVAEGGAGSGGG